MIGFDTETHLIAPGRLCPRLVCMSLAGLEDPPDLEPGIRVTARRDGWTALLDRAQTVRWAPALFEQPVIIGHNTAYDLATVSAACQEETGSDAVLTAVFEALCSERIHDTQIREQLLAISVGELKFRAGEHGIEKTQLSLSALTKRYLGVDLSDEKTDPNGWRLRFRELDGIPVESWPEDPVRYAEMDAYWPLLVAQAQTEYHQPEVEGYPVHDGWHIHYAAREVAAAFALHLMAIWGMRTDPDYVVATVREWEEGSQAGIALGQKLGFIRVKGRDKGKPGSVIKAKLQALVSSAYAGEPPMTEPSRTFPEGQVKTSEEVIENAPDPDLKEYALSLHYTNWRSKYEEPLLWGVHAPLTSRPNVLVSSGRTSWGDPPMQQPPRKGGFRGCFVPRKGWLYASADYDFVELCTLAQVCLWSVGRSRLAQTINDGLDPHIVTAIEILRAYGHPETPASYEEAIQRKADKDPVILEHRQLAKPMNFGLPGGLGADSFVDFAWQQYSVQLTVEKSRELGDIWKVAYPEMPEYFRWVKDQLGLTGNTVQQFVSGRVRGGVTFTKAANTYFQGLAADGAKFGAFLISKACYSEPDSALFGCRPVLFLHDENIIEAPVERAAEAGHEMSRIMIAAMREHVPDVRIGAKAVLSRRWLKGADPTYRDGILVPTEA